jgi:hypothetical protein
MYKNSNNKQEQQQQLKKGNGTEHFFQYVWLPTYVSQTPSKKKKHACFL